MSESMHGRSLIIGAFAVVPLLGVAALAIFMVPNFVTMFASFGVDLPFETRLLLATYRFWGVLALGVAVLAWVLRGNRDAMIRLLIGSWVASVVLVVFCGLACYSPILRLAASV